MENDIIYDICYRINQNELDEEQLKLINNRELLSKIIQFKSNSNNTLMFKLKTFLIFVFIILIALIIRLAFLQFVLR